MSASTEAMGSLPSTSVDAPASEGGSEAFGEGVTGPSSVESLWAEARSLIGNTGDVVKLAAKVLGKTVSVSKLTAEDLTAVIAAKREAA